MIYECKICDHRRDCQSKKAVESIKQAWLCGYAKKFPATNSTNKIGLSMYK